MPGDTNGADDLFIRDRDTDADGIFDEAGAATTIRVSVANDGAQGTGGVGASLGDLSANGRFVAFTATFIDLVSGDTNNQADVFVRDRDVDGNGVFDEPLGSATIRVSLGPGGVQADGLSEAVDISPDGSVVAFVSAALVETLAPLRRRTITRTELAPLLTAADFSTVAESDQPIVLDRTMSWDSTGYGSHAETAVESPATTWYLAEGSTSGDFALFYLLQNPNPTATTATVRYLLPFGQAPIEKSYALPASARVTIPVDTQGPEFVTTDVSAVITAPVPIIVERAMYLSRPGQVCRGSQLDWRHRSGHQLVPRRRGDRSVLRSLRPARESESAGGRRHGRLPAARRHDLHQEPRRAGDRPLHHLGGR